MAIDLKSMTRKELLALKSDIDSALIDAEKREKQAALDAARQAAAEFGFSLDDLACAVGKTRTRKTTKSEPKYRNPDNPSDTWTGRGRKPSWVHAAIEKGVDLATLEI